jgi:glycolate oxidase
MSWISQLRRSHPSLQLTTQAPHLEAHSGDAWFAAHPPDAVAFPKSVAEISGLLKFCSKKGVPVTPRGAGRGYVGGCVPVQGGVALSLKRLNRIKKISFADSIAVTEPSVITAHLQHKVERLGLFYPPDPASLRECSIGGNIATNAGGPRCLKYGVTRNYVLGLQVVLASGEVVRAGGATHKNKVGFNLSDLFIGSEGMLGVVTEATLRLIPKPPGRSVVVATFPDATDAARAVLAIQKAGFLPSALEIADRFTLQAARQYVGKSVPPGNALLLVELDGQIGSVKRELKQLIPLLKKAGAVRTLQADNDADAAVLWNIRRQLSYSLKATGLTKLNEDVVVPRSKLVELFRLGEKIAKQTGYQVACFGHAGDGNIHVNLMTTAEEAKSARAHEALGKMFAQIVAWGGSITGEHGIGLAKKPWWNIATSPELRNLHHTVKNALDPKGILNPGKFLG